ncbi:type I restriction-modification system subunit M N-terminal domain-containing protein [Staphylococcus pseudintermedius]|uniref:type I restriction-modification system subunit M N-terminal domain-containing protein n=1 Tax=Staphylococcus pseudintermedius TaxID=283734 RepID=UPI003B8A7D85
MDASEFRNYILGLIFYRFLSEKAEAEGWMHYQAKIKHTKKLGQTLNTKKI